VKSYLNYTFSKDHLNKVEGVFFWGGIAQQAEGWVGRIPHHKAAWFRIKIWVVVLSSEATQNNHPDFYSEQVSFS
jgi:hypothetical protein